MKYIIILLFFFSIAVNLFAKDKQDPINFFIKEEANKEEKWTFNEYENIISGIAAFTIGNVGYATTDSSVLGLTYSAIQTIGIINIGQGIYKMNSPSIEGSFKEVLTNKNIKSFSRSEMASHVIEIFAQEKRAKRLSIFYISTFLAAQYFINATVYDSPSKLKNIYIFLGGVNAIISAYSALNKSSYEDHVFGKDIDLNPFAFKSSHTEVYGANLVVRF